MCASLVAGEDVSPWHDIPLHGEDGALNFICEIPKETAAKMEVATVGGASHREPAAFELRLGSGDLCSAGSADQQWRKFLCSASEA